jgi:hypothetical protein
MANKKYPTNRVTRSLKFEEVPGSDIWWRNMQGSPTDFSPAGKRSFAIAIDDELADELKNEGWTCIAFKPRDKNDPDSPILPRFKINMNFNGATPPKIYVASSDGKRRTMVDENWLDDQNIDRRGIEWIDIAVNPYNWVVNGNEGCSAYLSELTIKLQEGAFDYKYAEDVPF